ncbi:Uncharacterized protein APZ42_016559 [Daphnia magna]|uniref:Uncharacterized protein n=1 Tax=Daphnia magna TaxID=35525 RepID=A0A0P5TGR3_9CRUS|nr:Uncharacterized protein APZ42_016559 [Daphnia magna]
MSDMTMDYTGDASQAEEAIQSPETCVPKSPSSPLLHSKVKSEDGSDIETKHKAPEGGRLQFYFDGKIVLELNDRRENGKTWWVPVTQKTYWPPPPPSCSTPGSTVRQESSASFSVSDESSVQSQSSPWLRETRWKNPNPTNKRTTSDVVTSDVEGFMFALKGRERCRYQWSQRRRPFRSIEQCHVGPNSECVQCKVGWRKKSLARPSVSAITSRLLEKALSKKMVASAVPIERIETLVSPRKRLLRDMEKVRLHDKSSSPSSSVLKKAKALMPATPLPTHSAAAMAAAAAAAVAHSLQPSKVYDRQSSYSIDSLLNKERQEEAAAASCSSSFLRSLLRKAPPLATNVQAVNGVRNKSLVSHQRRDGAISLAGGSRPLQPPVWLPYPVTAFPPPNSLAPGSSATLAARPGPSSSRRESLGNRLPRVPTPPDCNDDHDDDVPLNLTIRRAREHS